MTINVDYLNRCIQTLEGAFKLLQQIEQGDIAIADAKALAKMIESHNHD